MSLSTENLSQALPLLENILAPDELQSVLLAIKAQDPSKLPENFKTSFRTLTNTNPVEKSEVENSNVSIKDKARTDSGPIQKLVSAAALESNNLRDSAVCPLVGNTFGEVRYINNFGMEIQNGNNLFNRRLIVIRIIWRPVVTLWRKRCRGPRDKILKNSIVINSS